MGSRKISSHRGASSKKAVRRGLALLLLALPMFGCGWSSDRTSARSTTDAPAADATIHEGAEAPRLELAAVHEICRCHCSYPIGENMSTYACATPPTSGQSGCDTNFDLTGPTGAACSAKSGGKCSGYKAYGGEIDGTLTGCTTTAVAKH
jgi:hypothetical protein